MTEPNRIAAPYSSASLTANDFDHADWSSAQPIEITRKWSGEAAPASRHAEVRILWTEQSLAIRFDCRQQEALNVNPNPRRDQKTMRLWDRDVCEIFLAPNPATPDQYYEFEAAPNGEWIDIAIRFIASERESDFEFQSGMTTATRIDDGQLVTIICVPWSERLMKPQRGSVWRVNLFRCIGVGDERYLAWLPTFAPEPNFHVPEVFGWLDFE